MSTGMVIIMIMLRVITRLNKMLLSLSLNGICKAVIGIVYHMDALPYIRFDLIIKLLDMLGVLFNLIVFRVHFIDLFVDCIEVNLLELRFHSL